MANRLAGETSPYLLQHKDNPVDWYPWGPDALRRAQKEDRPILLSIGYAACHWCHVMEKESFEDPRTADQMNENFVCIKVDREERPDLDTIYMTAVQSMTGHGGWPMTVFLTPAGEPFYGGTYFPPEDRHGLPAFTKVLQAIAQAWEQQRSALEDQSRRLIEHISVTEGLRASTDPIEPSILDEALDGLKESFDEEWGGFGRAPKFPQPMTLDLLLRIAHRGNPTALQMVRRTLDAMADGGIFDQLGGGFARYSVDRHWLVPHFEKMLYDNALLLRTYARAHLLTGEHRYRHVAEATAEWMLAEMRDPDGGFYSSLDADSEGEEGRFYVWTIGEIEAAARADAEAAIAHWGASEDGNFEGRNILVYATQPADPEAVARARAALLARRAERIRPATDDKVLAAWNGLAAAALAESGAALGHPEWIEAAASAVGFVLDRMRIDGRLMRSYRAGRVNHLGCSDDYAFTLEGCLALYEATFEQRWLTEAQWAARAAIELFLDDGGDGFFLIGRDAEKLVTRPKEIFDNAVPSPNSVMALELQRLALLLMDPALEAPAVGAIRIAIETARRAPHGFGHLLCAVDFYLGSPKEIVIAGDPSALDSRSLLDVVRATFLPNKVLAAGEGSPPPVLADRKRINGRATAFVCERGSCRLPVDDAHALEAQLAEL